MTPEERKMLAELADRLAQTPAPAHDPEADEFIRTNIGRRPDALYILTQTTLIQNLAIQHAQQEIQELKQRLAQPTAAQPASSFLGTGMAPGGSRPAGVSGTSPWSAPPAMPPPIPQSAPPASEAPSFLRSAAQTAAGVAAGAFAFEGIRALFGGFGGGPHFGGLGGGSFLGGAPGGETIVNNYYDTPDAAEKDVSERTDRDDDRDDSSSNDATASGASDDTDASAEDASLVSDDTSSDDDTYNDDGSDDNGGYDDGGGSGGDDFA